MDEVRSRLLETEALETLARAYVCDQAFPQKEDAKSFCFLPDRESAAQSVRASKVLWSRRGSSDVLSCRGICPSIQAGRFLTHQTSLFFSVTDSRTCCLRKLHPYCVVPGIQRRLADRSRCRSRHEPWFHPQVNVVFFVL